MSQSNGPRTPMPASGGDDPRRPGAPALSIPDTARPAATRRKGPPRTRRSGRSTEAPPAPPAYSTWATAAIGWALFIAFLTYFNVTSNILPHGAGPDYAAHDDISRFIYENKRLVVLPDDEDAIKFTPYGGTRALRPPLTYILSAALSHALDGGKTKLEILFRKSSALLGALTVLIIFQCCLVYFASPPLAVAAAVVVGLMPQFTFIASYNNDDAGAIFSASLMYLAMAVVFRRGPGWRSLALMGLAAGMVIITKPSAWLIAPVVVLFAVMYIMRHLPKVIGPIIVGLLIAALTGGWWIAKNIHDYGPQDPLLQKAVKVYGEKHSRFDPDRKFGYAANGVTAMQLLQNHRGFLDGTALSTVGNLDWLRLRLGKPVYWFYYGLGILAFLYVLWRLVSLLMPGRISRPREFGFEMLLVVSLGVQFGMYMWANLYNDIQIQGKYLLPALLAVVLLSFSGLRTVTEIAGTWTSRQSGKADPRGSEHSIPVMLSLLSAVLVISALFIHRGALVNFVFPYYKPDFYQEPLRPVTVAPFVGISIDPENIHATNQMENLELTDTASLQFTATGSDPWFVPQIRRCAGAKDNTLVRIAITAPAKGVFAVYWDDGLGFSPKNRSTTRYSAGRSELHVWISPRKCRKLRFDPGRAAGTYIIHGIAIAQVDIGPVKPD